MMVTGIAELSQQDKNKGIALAANSARRRHPKLLHKPGAEFNRVFNFMMHDSYMQPHLHPGEEKVEKIYLVEGKIAALFFDEQGAIKERTLLEKGGIELIEVPAFTWHTYVMLSEHAITYETMMGVYEPSTWKHFAPWAPPEDAPESSTYLNALKEAAASSA
jgi:cupin fold WbuC family metalloprotein